MESNDYRLERWLAILLSLLFFLPFVARADELAYTGSYHGDELPYANGEQFLALTTGYVLVPVKIDVEAEEDPFVDNPGERTGKRVSVVGFEELFLVRGKNLHPGKVTPAHPDFAELMVPKAKAVFVLGTREYQLSYRCRAEDCTLMLASGEVLQDLETVVAEDLVHYVSFAGDLDHDGRLDLIVDLSRHYNESRPTLWLSSAAKDGQLLGMTAELATTGC